MATSNAILINEGKIFDKLFIDHYFSVSGPDLKCAELWKLRGPGYNHSEDRKFCENSLENDKLKLTATLSKTVRCVKKIECETNVPENITISSNSESVFRILKRALKYYVCTQSLTSLSLGHPPACLDCVRAVVKTHKVHVVDHALLAGAVGDSGHLTVITPDSSVGACSLTNRFLLASNAVPGATRDDIEGDCNCSGDCIHDVSVGQGPLGAQPGDEADKEGGTQEGKLPDDLISFHIYGLDKTGNTITLSATAVSSCGVMSWCEIPINMIRDLLTSAYFICDLLTPTRLHHTVCGCGV